MKLDVPYYSQYLDVLDSYWMPRGCGMVCIKSVLDYFGLDTPLLQEMLEKGSEQGGYQDQNGWVHDYLVEVLQSAGLNAYRKEALDEESVHKEIVPALEAGNPVIVSITKRTLEQTKFHLIVLVGFTKNGTGEIDALFYHDPENTSRERGAFRQAPIETFLSGWRGMAIFAFPNVEK